MDRVEHLSQPAIKKILVQCLDCEQSLRAENGMVFPLHKAKAIVTETQLESWKSQGFNVVEVSPS